MPARIENIKIPPIAYNLNSEEDSSILDVEKFTAKDKCLILSSKYIPKDTKIYMEVEIYDFPKNKKVNYLPLYLGVHKIPSPMKVRELNDSYDESYDKKYTNEYYLNNSYVYTTSNNGLIVTIENTNNNTKTIYDLSDEEQKAAISSYISQYKYVNRYLGGGILETEFCVGSVFTTNTRDSFTVLQRTGDIVLTTDTDTGKTKSTLPEMRYTLINRESDMVLPLINDSIGLGVDSSNNIITIFVNGNKLYDFSPDFEIGDSSDYFLAMYYSMFGSTVSGLFNLGLNYTKYKPDGYDDIYSIYYDNSGNFIDDIDLDASIDKSNISISYHNIEKDPTKKFFPIITSLDGSYSCPITFIFNHLDMEILSSNNQFRIHANTFTIETEPDIAILKNPIPVDTKIYFEILLDDVYISSDYVGIPISIGFMKSDNSNASNPEFSSIYKNSYIIDLYKYIKQGFNLYYYENGTKHEDGIISMMNPITPSLNFTIGCLIDIENNLLALYTSKLLFCKISLSKLNIDTTNDIVRLFIISYPTMMSNPSNYNLLDSYNRSTIFTLISGNENEIFRSSNIVSTGSAISLNDYYNYYIIRRLYNYNENTDDNGIDIRFSIRVPSESVISYYINFSIDVNTMTDEDQDMAGGINQLWSTYNKVSDIKAHNNTPDISIYDIDKLIEESNNKRS